MKFSTLLTGALVTLTVAQTPAPYTDAKSGITFNTLQHSSGAFFGIALPADTSQSTDFIATIGGKGTGWTGVSLGGGMLNKLLIVAWPNAQNVISSFRKTAPQHGLAVLTEAFTYFTNPASSQTLSVTSSIISNVTDASHSHYGSPAVATGTFTQTPIANGTYVNSTHWTYTFLCSKCIQSDGTTFKSTDTAPSIGFAVNLNAPSQKTNPASALSKHSAQGQAVFDLSKAQSDKFETWKAYATPKITRVFQG